MLAARVIVAIENPEDVVAISARPWGMRAVLKFAHYTGAQSIAGRFTPGTFTNQITKQFREPRLLVVTEFSEFGESFSQLCRQIQSATTSGGMPGAFHHMHLTFRKEIDQSFRLGDGRQSAILFTCHEQRPERWVILKVSHSSLHSLATDIQPLCEWSIYRRQLRVRD